MLMGNVGQHVKDPDEVIAVGRWGIDWSPDLAEDETVTGVEMKMLDSEGADQAETMLSEQSVVGGRYTTAQVQAGVSGQAYRWLHRITTSGGSTMEDYIVLLVQANEP